MIESFYKLSNSMRFLNMSLLFIVTSSISSSLILSSLAIINLLRFPASAILNLKTLLILYENSNTDDFPSSLFSKIILNKLSISVIPFVLIKLLILSNEFYTSSYLIIRLFDLSVFYFSKDLRVGYY